jgi:ketosteroid isomerase-like protein
MNDGNNANDTKKTFEFAQSLFLNKDLNGFSDLFATDGVFELPFSPQKSNRIIKGRENIRAYLATVPIAALKPIGYKSTTIYETNDPEVIIAEYDMFGEVIATGLPFQLRYIQMVKVHNGEIVTLHDYWNPFGFPEILNRLPELFSMITQN